MVNKNKMNTMTSFFILFTLFVAIATTNLIFITYQDVKQKTLVELEYINKLSSKGLNYEIRQYEILLRLLGERLLEIDVLNNPQNAKKLVQELLNADKSLAGLGVIKTDGQLIFISNVQSSKELPNLLNNSFTSNTFKNLINNNTKDINIGRTYYMPLLKKWVIPLRISIYDKNAKKAFILAVGIDIEQSHPWKLENLTKNILMALIREDTYFLYASFLQENEKIQYYDHPVPTNTMKQFSMTKLLSQGTKTLNIIDRNNVSLLVSTQYQSKYKYISIAAIPYQEIYSITFYNLIYFLVGIFMFYAFALIFYIITNAKDKKQQNELTWSANHDLLTNLPNRYFLERKIKKWNNKYSQYSILFLDLDNFKFINDNYGHPFGDKLLVVIASRLNEIIEPFEYVIRQGGDEFIIITSKIEEELKIFTEHILHIISEVASVENILIHPKVSIGIANYPDDGQSLEVLLSKADLALYKAKEDRGTYVIFSDTLEMASKEHLDIEQQLRTAYKNREFHVLLQPQVNAKTLKIEGVEALVRWENNTLGFVTPDKFISIAEEIGEIHNIGHFVLEEACTISLNVFKATGIYFNLSVNASAQELLHDEYLSNILNTLEKVKFPRERLTIEVTESILIQDVHKAKQVLNSLRSEGISVSLDDFGTGYSSLSMLRGLPVTELKIDQSFIRDILIDKQDLSLTKSIITLAQEFNLTTVAEGVEEDGQVKELQKAGCTIFQGYYFSKPINQEALIAFINDA